MPHNGKEKTLFRRLDLSTLYLDLIVSVFALSNRCITVFDIEYDLMISNPDRISFKLTVNSASFEEN